MSKLEKHAAAERVIEEGDLARDIYVVVDGRLEVWIERNGERKQLNTLGRGAVLGEAGFFGQRRTANVQALTSVRRSEEHTSELQSLMRISYAVFCLKKKKNRYTT